MNLVNFKDRATTGLAKSIAALKHIALQNTWWDAPAPVHPWDSHPPSPLTSRGFRTEPYNTGTVTSKSRRKEDNTDFGGRTPRSNAE
jgi:hypothetical protein